MKHEYHEGPKAGENFKALATTAFRPKSGGAARVAEVVPRLDLEQFSQARNPAQHRPRSQRIVGISYRVPASPPKKDRPTTPQIILGVSKIYLGANDGPLSTSFVSSSRQIFASFCFSSSCSLLFDILTGAASTACLKHFLADCLSPSLEYE